jgi:hypothetical protein
MIRGLTAACGSFNALGKTGPRLAFRHPSTYVRPIERVRDGLSVHSERDKMSESITNLADVENDILHYEIADEAVEAAAALLEGQGKNATISFCSGLDSCPS